MGDFGITMGVLYGVGVFVIALISVLTYSTLLDDDKRLAAKLLRTAPVWPLALVALILRILQEPTDD